jgi:hypothetical protein
MPPDRIALLVAILRDRSARVDERDDAAIDPGESDDDRALAALLELGAQSDDEMVLGSIEESIAHIASRTGKFELSWLTWLSPPAVDELRASLRAVRPELLGK